VAEVEVGDVDQTWLKPTRDAIRLQLLLGPGSGLAVGSGLIDCTIYYNRSERFEVMVCAMEDGSVFEGNKKLERHPRYRTLH
jgi:hypothetical protein